MEGKVKSSGTKAMYKSEILKLNAQRVSRIFDQLPKVLEYELIYYTKSGYRQLTMKADDLKDFFKGAAENYTQDKFKEFVESWMDGTAAIVSDNGQITASSTSAMFDARRDSKLLNSSNEK